MILYHYSDCIRKANNAYGETCRSGIRLGWSRLGIFLWDSRHGLGIFLILGLLFSDGIVAQNVVSGASPKVTATKKMVSDKPTPNYHSLPSDSDQYFTKQDVGWDLSLYAGQYTETDLLPILFQGDIRWKNSQILVVGLSKPLDFRFRMFRFEVEGNIGKHFGLMNHWEANGLYIARIPNLFSLPFSFAIGNGLSLASQNPRLENKPTGFHWDPFHYQHNAQESRNILNYLMVELEWGRRDSEIPRIFIRIHHRSGIFGLYCKPDPACGSNFITIGARTALNRWF